jgi:hypothetical protein
VRSEKDCLLFENCPSLDDSCSDCVSGELGCTHLIIARDCADLMNITGGEVSGIQEITPIEGGPAVKVMCDQEGWTVFQSRGDFGNPADYFFREWKDYQEGFGEAGTN